MQGLFAAVLGVEAGDEGVQVVAVLGVAESLEHLSHQDLASSGISLAMGLHDGPVELTAKPPQDPHRRWAVVGPRDSGQQRSTTVPSGQRYWQVDSRNPSS